MKLKNLRKRLSRIKIIVKTFFILSLIKKSLNAENSFFYSTEVIQGHDHETGEVMKLVTALSRGDYKLGNMIVFLITLSSENRLILSTQYFYGLDGEVRLLENDKKWECPNKLSLYTKKNSQRDLIDLLQDPEEFDVFLSKTKDYLSRFKKTKERYFNNSAA